MPIKLFELKGDDFAKGISVYDSKPERGLFQQASSFNPFRDPGTLRSVPSGVSVGAGTIDTTINNLVGVNSGGTPLLYGFSTTKLWEINVLTDAVADKSAEVTLVTAGKGAIVYNGKIVYALGTSIRANAIPVASASDIRVLGSSALQDTEHPMTIGADKNLYIANGQFIARITDVSAADPATNSVNVFDMGTGVRIRKLINDGRYLVVLADNNASQVLVNGGAVVAYWDYVSPNLTQRHDFDEQFLMHGGIIGKDIYVFGRNNMYITNLGTPPQVFVPFKSPSLFASEVPQNSPHTVISTDGQIHYGTSDNIISFGHPTGGKKIFYKPVGGFSNLSAMTFDFRNSTFWTAASSGTRLERHNGTARTTAIVRTVEFPLERAYSLSYYKVYLRQVLVSGDQVDLQLRRSDGGVAIGSVGTFSFANSGAKYTGIVKPAGNTNSPNFESFDLDVQTNGPIVWKVEVWAEPMDIVNQQV